MQIKWEGYNSSCWLSHHLTWKRTLGSGSSPEQVSIFGYLYNKYLIQVGSFLHGQNGTWLCLCYDFALGFYCLLWYECEKLEVNKGFLRPLVPLSTRLMSQWVQPEKDNRRHVVSSAMHFPIMCNVLKIKWHPPYFCSLLFLVSSQMLYNFLTQGQQGFKKWVASLSESDCHCQIIT